MSNARLARLYARTFYVLLAIYLGAAFAHGAGWIHVEAIHGLYGFINQTIETERPPPPVIN